MDSHKSWRQIRESRYQIVNIRAPEYQGSISFGITTRSNSYSSRAFTTSIRLNQDELKQLIADLQSFVEEG